jgi:hypothetical protein
VTAAPAKIAISLARYPRLDLGNRFDGQLRLLDEIVKAAAGDRVPASVDDDCGFDKIRSRNAAMGSCLDGFGAGRRLGSSRRIAISADVSMIIAASRSHHKAGQRDRLYGRAP